MLALTAATKLGAQQPALDSIVDHFFPQSLIELWNNHSPDSPPKSSAYKLVALDGAGSPNYIAAAYDVGGAGAFRLLKLNGNNATLVAAPDVSMNGFSPTVSLIDVDGDGKSEILVEFTTNGATRPAWIFQWANGALREITPDDDAFSEGEETNFADLDGDGVLELIEAPPHVKYGDLARLNGTKPIRIWTTYRLTGGTYQPSAQYFWIEPFIRVGGAPETSTSTFVVDSPGTNFVLKISNGANARSVIEGQPFRVDPATSADVYLNGVLVVGPSSFNPNVKVITVPVTLQATNTISVTLRGAPNTGFTIAIGKQTN
jgi:hypothetical protein